jgi:hypothetical protein
MQRRELLGMRTAARRGFIFPARARATTMAL